MWLLRQKEQLFQLLWLIPLLAGHVRGQLDSPPSPTHDATKLAPTTPTVQPTCESKTVNYITHTLPQQCLTSISTAEPTSTTVADTAASSIPDPADLQEEHELDSDGNDLSTGAFMSFEEWKEMMLKKSGQETLEARPRKTQDGRGEPAPGEDFDTLGDDGEIALNFDAYSDKFSEITSATKPQKEREEAVEKLSPDDGVAHIRSKDAGVTCKERFSYSSFDAGATVKKASPGAKNPKAILVENKDSYMLLECAMENKFFIVELSDDILVDTVVLANFEFFSSMIRKFRVSVSDRYPVKLEKWKILGEFQARNSRDIQPFAVENPQIWARYLRVEILSHYGNEYYCPLSLLRVHGTRMLDSWKEADPSEAEGELEGEEEPIKTLAEPAEEIPKTVEVTVEDVEDAKVEEPVQIETQTAVMEQSCVVSYWDESYFRNQYPQGSTCGMADSPVLPSHTNSEGSKDHNAAPAKPQPVATAEQTTQATISTFAHTSSETSMPESGNYVSSASSSETTSSSTADSTPDVPAPTSSPATELPDMTQTPSSKMTAPISVKLSDHPVSKNKTVAATSLKPPSKSSAPKPSAPMTVRNKTATSTSSSNPASPTVQDSFFKQLTKRLQTLESNTTLSLQYIESQSKFLQEALSKLERRQVAKVDHFLNTLNKTVLSELREVRTQYDQIWQSTVIALETQREQSEREIVALSSRLGVLADEVVFQKRMAIVQSVLLLGCLILVIFSRGLASAGMELYYPSQFLASHSRVASPVYPSTPKSLRKGQHHSTGTLRESIEQNGTAMQNEETPPRPSPDASPTPKSEPHLPPQRHFSLPELSPRPLSPCPSASEVAGLDFYEPPTPASLDAGYDSEPATSPPNQDYFSQQASTNGDRESSLSYNDMPVRRTTEHRQLAPSSETDGTNGGGMDYTAMSTVNSHRGAARPPMSHVGSSRKPLPALPEDPDPD
jgi:hypothetical protein